MSKWRMVNLGKLTKIKTGKLDANASSESGQYPFFTCSKEPLKIDTFSYDCECVLVAGNGDLSVKYYNGKFDAYQRTYIIESVDKSILYVPYLYNFLNKYVEKLREQSIGGVIKYIKLGNLTDARLPLPPLEEQKRIAETLDKAQNIIDTKKKQLQKLDLLVKSRFIEMFGDPIKNHMKWDVCKLGDITTTIQSGNTPKGGKDVYVSDGILFFRSQNIWKNMITIKDVVFIDKETHEKMNNTQLMNNDILITKTGRFNTENSSLGRAALFKGENYTANINGHVYLVRLMPNISHVFILHILISNEYKKLIRSMCVGGIDKRQINKEHLEEFPIILPPISLQNLFADFVVELEKTKETVQKSLEQTETLHKALMQKYFGEKNEGEK